MKHIGVNLRLKETRNSTLAIWCPRAHQTAADLQRRVEQMQQVVVV
jgi:hypothetical protein